MSAKIVRNLAYEIEQEGNTVSILCSADLVDESDNTTTAKQETIEVVTDADQWKFHALYKEAVMKANLWADALTKETE